MTPGKLYRFSEQGWLLSNEDNSTNLTSSALWVGTGPSRDRVITVQRKQVFLFIGNRPHEPDELSGGSTAIAMLFTNNSLCKFYGMNLNEEFEQVGW